MSKKPRWTENYIGKGFMEVEFSSWKYFHDYIRQEMLDYSHYIWRGQRDSDWMLESSLDRLLRGTSPSNRDQLAKNHLEKFKYAARGRRGVNPARIDDENEWWALGQHHGLATPLLDWSESPFVALYFAFEKEQRPKSRKRAVWALSPPFNKNKEIVAVHKGKGRPPTLDTVRPHQDENARLVSQSGLFTRGPLGETVDGWIQRNFSGDNPIAILLKLVLPEKGRNECLSTLNRMNINHVTLFPDLYGAGHHCNKYLQIDQY